MWLPKPLTNYLPMLVMTLQEVTEVGALLGGQMVQIEQALVHTHF